MKNMLQSGRDSEVSERQHRSTITVSLSFLFMGMNYFSDRLQKEGSGEDGNLLRMLLANHGEDFFGTLALGFILLSILLVLPVRSIPLLPIALAIGFIELVVEIVQLVIPWGTFDPFDLLAYALALFLFVQVGRLFTQWGGGKERDEESDHVLPY